MSDITSAPLEAELGAAARCQRLRNLPAFEDFARDLLRNNLSVEL
jgi:hypothetical protein